MDKPHGCDLRKGRVSLIDQVYLITTATSNRRPIFTNLKCARALIRVMLGESKNVETLAFVVMPDHLHWLFRLHDGDLDQVVSIKSIALKGHHIVAQGIALWRVQEYGSWPPSPFR